MSKTQVSTEVAGVLADFELTAGRMAMPAAKLTAWRGTMKKLVLSKRKPPSCSRWPPGFCAKARPTAPPRSLSW